MPLRVAAFVLAVVGGIAVAAPADAKGPVSLAICGPEDCVTLRGERRIELFMQQLDTVAVGESPTTVAAFYRLDMTIGAHGREYSRRMYFVPSPGFVRGDSGNDNAHWARLTPTSAAALTKLAANIRPFPAPTIVGASVGGRPVVGDPSTYLRLFSLPVAEYPAPTASDWVPVDLRSTDPSPWTDRRWDLAYSPKKGVLERANWIVVLSPSLSDDVGASRALFDEGEDFPWAKIALVLAVIAALAAVFVPLARKRPLPHSGPPPASSVRES